MFVYICLEKGIDHIPERISVWWVYGIFISYFCFFVLSENFKQKQNCLNNQKSKDNFLWKWIFLSCQNLASKPMSWFWFVPAAEGTSNLALEIARSTRDCEKYPDNFFCLISLELNFLKLQKEMMKNCSYWHNVYP